MTETTPSPLGNVITIDDERIKSHLDRVVRGSVEETLKGLKMLRYQCTLHGSAAKQVVSSPWGAPLPGSPKARLMNQICKGCTPPNS